MKIADDPIYGTIRAAICDEWIAAGEPKPERNWLYSRLVEARLELQDHRTLLDVQHARTAKADQLWQEAHQRPNVLPDLGSLIDWLLARAQHLEEEIQQLRQMARAALLRTSEEAEVAGKLADANHIHHDLYALAVHLRQMAEEEKST